MVSFSEPFPFTDIVNDKCYILYLAKYIPDIENIGSEYMKGKELSKTEKKILQHIALKGLKTEYDIFQKDKIASSSTVWKADRKLRNLGFIEIKRTERFNRIPSKSKNYLGLTFKGLILAVKLHIVEPKNARRVREINQTELPKTEAFGSLVEDMEKNFPEIFYNSFNLDSRMITDKSLPGITTGVALFTFFMLPGINPGYFKKYIKEKGLILPDGSIFDDYEKVFEFFSVFIKPMFPKGFQQALEKGFRKVLGYEY